MANATPTIRWGIVATGLISSWFVAEILIDRPDAKAHHTVQAIASSSQEKGKAFAEKHAASQSPTIYGAYADIYGDPNVDVIYIGTPHAFHKQNCLDAIAAGKHVLCEKPFALNIKEAEEVFAAAKAKGVFVMEGMWTRFFPLVEKLRTLVHTERTIGQVRRVFTDFAMDMKIESLPMNSRLRNPALGAGTLLDVGIYSLLWPLLTLDANIGAEAETPKIVAAQHLSEDGVDLASSIILMYKNGGQAISTSSSFTKTPPGFCRIEGSKGHIIVEGFTASVPAAFTVFLPGVEEKKYTFDKVAKGFYYEADAVALAIQGGKTESEVMPWAETLRVLKIMDEIRRQGGAKFPQDHQ